VILIGLGANLSSPVYGTPRETLDAALAAIEEGPVRIAARSPFYRSAPVPASDQPWFVNAVASLETSLNPLELLEFLQDIETRFGRVRERRWDARVLDLDLLAYDDRVVGHPAADSADAALIVPHPRLAERLFVLRPLADIAPAWRHPITGSTPNEMIMNLEFPSEVVLLEA
jgi:2-amino-4-hydroxy-6-hydroxymethyldihydropteridine diphosphokinase